jgi:hypothetical protein
MPASIFVRPDGTVEFLYEDGLRPLLELGSATITRASHVEPTPDSGWTADLSPRCGPRLGPFTLRQEALDAERAWLETHRLGALPEPRR